MRRRLTPMNSAVQRNATWNGPTKSAAYRPRSDGAETLVGPLQTPGYRTYAPTGSRAGVRARHAGDSRHSRQRIGSNPGNRWPRTCPHPRARQDDVAHTNEPVTKPPLRSSPSGSTSTDRPLPDGSRERRISPKLLERRCSCPRLSPWHSQEHGIDQSLLLAALRVER